MLRGLIRKILKNFGFIRVNSDERFADMEPDFIEMYERYKRFTLTSIERMYVLYKAVEYISLNGIPGDLVECGVYRGGSVMLMASTLLALGDDQRRIFLYDTYEGMTEPTDKDVNVEGVSATTKWRQTLSPDGTSSWCASSLDEVKRNLAMTGIPEDRLEFVKGKIEYTLPEYAPHTVALLRLDTDFYESTYHELSCLYPRLSRGGVLIIDDYGHWKGSKEAADTYIRESRLPIFLSRVDYAGRVAIKT